MSVTAAKLMEKNFDLRQEKKENYLPLLCAIFGNDNYNTDAPEVAELVQAALDELEESSPLGSLQKYCLEEHFLFGKSKEEICKELCDHVDALFTDLVNPSIRYLRHPSRAKELRRIVK